MIRKVVLLALLAVLSQARRGRAPAPGTKPKPKPGPTCAQTYKGPKYQCCLIAPTKTCGPTCIRDKCEAKGDYFGGAYASEATAKILYNCCKPASNAKPGDKPKPPSGMKKVYSAACWKNTYGRGVGRPIHTCRKGEEQSGLLCYPPCKSGFGGLGPVCWEKCKPGYHTAILLPFLCEKGVFEHKYTKKSYGRGVGKPLTCDFSKEELNGLLCYPHCRKGYKGNGPVCWSNCPPGWHNCGGAMCTRSKEKCTAKILKIVGSAISSVGAFATVVGAGVGIGQAITFAGHLTLPKCRAIQAFQVADLAYMLSSRIGDIELE